MISETSPQPSTPWNASQEFEQTKFESEPSHLNTGVTSSVTVNTDLPAFQKRSRVVGKFAFMFKYAVGAGERLVSLPFLSHCGNPLLYLYWLHQDRHVNLSVNPMFKNCHATKAENVRRNLHA